MGRNRYYRGKLQEDIILREDQCTACGLCIRVCPQGCWQLSERSVVCNQGNCFSCGHCQAICPASAIQVPGLDSRPVFNKDNDSSRDQSVMAVAALEMLMAARRSCRCYQDKAVPRELLHQLVRMGQLAPSGTNSQSWGFYLLVERRQVLGFGRGVAEYYRRLNRMAANWPLRKVLAAVGYPQLASYYRDHYDSVADALLRWDNNGEDLLFHGAVAAVLVSGADWASCPAEDALLATQNMLLAAEALGLGSCLIGFAVEALRRDQKLRASLQLPRGHQVYSVIALGYPALHYKRPAGRQWVAPVEVAGCW